MEFFKSGSASSKGPRFLSSLLLSSSPLLLLSTFRFLGGGAREEPLTNYHPEIPEPVLQLVGAHSNPSGKRIIIYGNSSREYLRKLVRPKHNTDLWRAIVAEGKDDQSSLKLGF
jgi:hypothetical protein